ncbi:DNA polymerase III [Kitasatospora sp. MMS16-BH015]|nr:DNA polymerase III [Kitasatospora sp. MMS16-BH015]
MLQGRVMVAHNAQFDYDFLAREFAVAGRPLPVSRRLCTVALNRRLGTPTGDMRLDTLATFYGVARHRAHDALDDTRVLAGVLRHSLAQAARLGVPLPLVACPPRRGFGYGPTAPKVPCGYRNPGRLAKGGPLVQGMKVAITGETTVPREELVHQAVAAGLNVMSSVSRLTSLLVTNDLGSGSAKAKRAMADGIPVVDEGHFRRLLENVQRGVAHEVPGGAHSTRPKGAPIAGPPPLLLPSATRSRPARRARGRLTGRRVLVLGGVHADASATRARVVELGGAAAVNLSAAVTDVVVLSGGEADRRMERIETLGLAVHRPGWPDTTAVEPDSGAGEALTAPAPAAQVLPRGGVADLPVSTDGTSWTVSASWAQQTSCEVDVVAFSLDQDEQVARDEDFVFYGAPESPDGTVHLSTDGPMEQAITVDLAPVPDSVRKIAIAAAIDGFATFGEVGAVEITLAAGISARPVLQSTLDAATTERTLLLAEIYRRGSSWRLRVVGQGFDHGLDTLARDYGVNIED